MTDNRNTILAVILSGLVLIAWQYFYNVPEMEKQRAAAAGRPSCRRAAPQPRTGFAHEHTAAGRQRPGRRRQRRQLRNAPTIDRDTAIAATPRVKIDTPSLTAASR